MGYLVKAVAPRPWFAGLAGESGRKAPLWTVGAAPRWSLYRDRALAIGSPNVQLGNVLRWGGFADSRADVLASASMVATIVWWTRSADSRDGFVYRVDVRSPYLVNGLFRNEVTIAWAVCPANATGFPSRREAIRAAQRIPADERKALSVLGVKLNVVDQAYEMLTHDADDQPVRIG